MPKQIFAIIFFISSYLVIHSSFAQSDSLKKNLSFSVGIEPYYGHAFQKNKDAIRFGGVNYNVTDAFNINLAYLELKYQSNKVRGKLIPGFGSYMDANYSSEFGLLKNLVEASVGYQLNEKHGIWLDVGILPSPFTNETAFARDHIMLTRSFCAENAPYYITGARLAWKASERITFYGYLLNGWQNIRETNTQKAGTLQFEYKKGDQITINWNVYAGYEGNDFAETDQERLFSDAYIIYKGPKRWSYTACIMGGRQYRMQNNNADFFSGNIAVNYQLIKPLSISGRIERISDVNKAISNQNFGSTSRGKISNSVSLGFNYQPQKEVLYRIECRRLFGMNKLYNDNRNEPDNLTWVVAAANFLF
jgi:hypothetical protein